MAFATSQVRTESAGSSWRTTGKWTGAVGDAAGTLTVPGAEVLSAAFLPNKSTGGPANPPSVSWTSTGGVATITVSNYVTVSDGRFDILSR